MKIRHLRIFKVVCEEKSITKAAEKLFMTQPAVSHTIIELEEHLGVELFDRISRKLYLNETGKLFLVKVLKLLDLYDALEKDIKELEENAVIKLGSCITIANFQLPRIVRSFEEECPKTPIRVIVDNARSIEERLSKNEIDLGLIEGVVYNEDLEQLKFSSYDISILVSPNHKLAKKSKITIKELTEEKLLLREKGSSVRDIFDSALMLHDIKVKEYWTSVNSQVLVNAAKENLGILVICRVLVEQEIESGELIEINVENLNLVNFNHIVFSKGKVQTTSFKKLIEIVKNIEVKNDLY